MTNHSAVGAEITPSDARWRSALRQVWANLVSNALKYSARRATPQVQIGVELRESEYVFHVRDNGAGFDPAQAHRDRKSVV